MHAADARGRVARVAVGVTTALHAVSFVLMRIRVDAADVAANREQIRVVFVLLSLGSVLTGGLYLFWLVAAVVTTLGADGAQVETAEGRISSTGFTPKIVDTTGAGDSFAAACLHARLAARLDWRDAIRFANCAAAISTTGLGAQSALPTADQVAAHLSATPTGS